MGLAFVGGLILNLMPCVFPILSMKAAALAGHGGESGHARAQGLAFLAGVLVTFLGLARALIAARAAGQSIGWGFQLQSPLVVAALGLIMLAAALNLSGLYEIGGSAQGLGSGLAARGGLAGSALTGVLAVVVAAPCTAPFMGPALGYALTQPALVALTVFAALGLGFAAPFTLLAFSPALMRRLPRPGAWMDVFRKALAFPMYAAAAWLAWVLAQQAGAGGPGPPVRRRRGPRPRRLAVRPGPAPARPRRRRARLPGPGDTERGLLRLRRRRRAASGEQIGGE